MSRSMSSKLKQRAELWGRTKVVDELGSNTYVDGLKRSIWCNFMPRWGALNQSDANTVYSNFQFKVEIRKETPVSNQDYLKYQGLRYDIKYQEPHFSDNDKTVLYCNLHQEVS